MYTQPASKHRVSHIYLVVLYFILYAVRRELILYFRSIILLFFFVFGRVVAAVVDVVSYIFLSSSESMTGVYISQ